MEIKKKVVAGLAATLSAAMLFSVAACGGDSGASDAPDDGSLMKVDVFSSTANYQGVQKGWFAKIVKDKFNMELNLCVLSSEQQLYIFCYLVQVSP